MPSRAVTADAIAKIKLSPILQGKKCIESIHVKLSKAYYLGS